MYQTTQQDALSSSRSCKTNWCVVISEAGIIIVYGLTDMDKPNTQCPPELTELSIQAVDDMNMVDILIMMQKNSIQLRIKTAIWQVIKGMFIVYGYLQTKCNNADKGKSVSDMAVRISRAFSMVYKVIMFLTMID